MLSPSVVQLVVTGESQINQSIMSLVLNVKKIYDFFKRIQKHIKFAMSFAIISIREVKDIEMDTAIWYVKIGGNDN